MRPEIETVELQQLYSGDRLALQAYKFRGHPGPKAYIQANLHGAEIVGNAVIFRLIEWLETLEPSILHGELWLVPACNPMGANQRTHFFSTGRYNSYDGRDWNRIFWDYEKEATHLDAYARARLRWPPERLRTDYLEQIRTAFARQQDAARQASFVPFHQLYRLRLQELCLDADYVIDIHSSSNHCLDYLYCFSGREDNAPWFGLELGLQMTEYDGQAFDEAFLKPWLALERTLAQHGRSLKFDLEAWTLELGCGMQVIPASLQKGIRGIKNYLAAKNLLRLPELPNPADKPAMRFFSRHQLRKYFAPAGGTIVERLPLGKPVTPGDRLYQLLTYDRTAGAPRAIDIHTERQGLVFDLATNQAANQGEYVLSVIEELDENPSSHNRPSS